MSNTPVSDISRLIRRGEPIEKHGLTWHPVKMDRFEEYIIAKPVLLLRQSTLPAKYAMMDFLQALYAMDFDSITNNGKPIGFLYKLILLMALALRLPMSEIEDNIKIETDGKRTLNSIIFRQEDVMARITPPKFRDIRSLIAEQNGEKLPDESDNPELIRAEQELADIKGEPLEYDLEALIDSVAYNSRVSFNEIMSWTVRQFEIRRKTIRRDKMFSLYTQAELGGMVKFQKGNPYPSYEFDRQKGDLEVLIPEHEIRAKYGKVADIRTQE